MTLGTAWRRVLVAAITIVALIAGIVLVPLLARVRESAANTPAPSATTPGTNAAEADGRLLTATPPGSRAAQGTPDPGSAQAVDPDVLAAAASPDAPEAGVDAVFLADDAARSDPRFAAVAKHLSAIGDGFFKGSLTSSEAESLDGVVGLRVALDRTIRLDHPAFAPADAVQQPLGSPYHLTVDNAVSVPEVDPSLADARASLGIQGTGQVIAIIDTGVDTNAIGLSGKVVYRQNFSPATAACLDDGFYDPEGHGTHVASIAAGAVNATDPTVAGVAPGAKLADLRVFNCAGETTDSAILAALSWVSLNHTARSVASVNLSLGASSGSQDGTDPLAVAINRLVAAGVFVSVASGNSGDAPSTIFSPGTARFATTVGAASVTQYGSSLAPYSSQGPIPAGDGVDLLAAGSSIRAAKSTALDPDWGPTIVDTGTSMSAPYVAGLAALLKQQHPSHAPSGTTCTYNPSTCPVGVNVASMTNQLEADMATSDWFTPGSDPISGRGLVSASDSLLGVATPSASHVEGTLDPAAPTMIEVPPHDQAVSLSIVTGASFPATASGRERLDFGWLSSAGDTAAVTIPCTLQITDRVYCATSAIDGVTVLTQRVWYFYSPPSTASTWLRLLPTQAAGVKVTAQGLGSPLVLRGGLSADDATLDGSGDATVTVTRAVASASATDIDIAPSPGLIAPASVTLASGAAGTTATIAVSQSASYVPPAGETAGRLALSSGGSLLLDVSVRYAAPEADVPGQITVNGDQIVSGDLVATNLVIATDGTILGDSTQPGLDRAPSATDFTGGPFIVEPGSNDAVPLAITQDVVSGISALGISADGNRILLREWPGGSGIVPGDTDSRDVFFVFDRSTGVSYEIGSVSHPPYADAARQPWLSQDGAAVAFLSPRGDGRHDLYWQGGSGFGTTNLRDTFPSGYTAHVRGVTSGRLLAEFNGWARLYSASHNPFGQQYQTVTLVAEGSSLLSVDGGAVGFVYPNGDSIGCYEPVNNAIYGFAPPTYYPESAMAPGVGCESLTGVVTRTDTWPYGWEGSVLETIWRGSSVTTLASSTRDGTWWVFDPTGAAIATIAGDAGGVGDTNGLEDVFRGGTTARTFAATGTPTISGAPGVGATLSASPGTWAPSSATFSYQWKRSGSAIVGAIGRSYRPVAADVGKTITVTVTGSSEGYIPVSATSAATARVKSDLSTFVPLISAITPPSAPNFSSTRVTITGLRLSGTTSVSFGGVAGTGLIVASDTSVSVVTPEGLSGAVAVVATNDIGSSTPFTFTYFAPQLPITPSPPPFTCTETSLTPEPGVPCHPDARLTP